MQVIYPPWGFQTSSTGNVIKVAKIM